MDKLTTAQFKQNLTNYKNLNNITGNDQGELSYKDKLIKTQLSTEGDPCILVDNKILKVKRVLFLIKKIDLTNLYVINLNGDHADTSIQNLIALTKGQCVHYHGQHRRKQKNYR